MNKPSLELKRHPRYRQPYKELTSQLKNASEQRYEAERLNHDLDIIIDELRKQIKQYDLKVLQLESSVNHKQREIKEVRNMLRNKENTIQDLRLVITDIIRRL